MNHARATPTRTQQITHLFAWFLAAVATTTIFAEASATDLGSAQTSPTRERGGLSGALDIRANESSPSVQPEKTVVPPPTPPQATPDTKQPKAPIRPTSFLLASEKHPHIKVSWPCTDKSITALQADLEYQAPKQSVPIGKNLTAYVALGGTRGDMGLGAPGAVDVRVGFYKVDKKKPMFDGLADDSAITVEFTGITFNQPARAKPATTVQHLKFEGNAAVLGCAVDPGVLATFNTLDPSQTIGTLVTKKNGRPGSLARKTGSVQASVTFSSDPAGAVSMKAVIPYALFKHADDPWLRSSPGDFTEPIHFHIEFECEPRDAPATEIKHSPNTEK